MKKLFRKKRKETGWDSVTIGQYNQLLRIEEMEFAEEMDRVIYTYCALSGEAYNDVLYTPINEMNKKLNTIAFIGEQLTPRISDKVEVNGKTYRLTTNIAKMSTGQYIDYMNVINNDPNNISLLTAIFYVPEGCKYSVGYTIGDLSKEFEEHFKIVDALGASSFFQLVLESLMTAIHKYLSKKDQKK